MTGYHRRADLLSLFIIEGWPEARKPLMGKVVSVSWCTLDLINDFHALRLVFLIGE